MTHLQAKEPRGWPATSPKLREVGRTRPEALRGSPPSAGLRENPLLSLEAPQPGALSQQQPEAGARENEPGQVGAGLRSMFCTQRGGPPGRWKPTRQAFCVQGTGAELAVLGHPQRGAFLTAGFCFLCIFVFARLDRGGRCLWEPHTVNARSLSRAWSWVWPQSPQLQNGVNDATLGGLARRRLQARRPR